VRLLRNYGRLLAAFGLVLLVLAATRWGEFRALEGSLGALIAIESATVRDARAPQHAWVSKLPVRSQRERRELVPLRAASAFELERTPGDSPWALYVEDFHDGGRLRVNGTLVADLPATDANVTLRQSAPLRFDLPAGVLRVGTNVIDREWAIHENMLLMPRMAVGEAPRIDQLFAPRDLAYRKLPPLTLVVALVLAFMMFSIYRGNREQKAYLWVALSAAGFAGVDVMFLLNAIPAAVFPYWRLSLFVAGSALLLGNYYFLLEVSGVHAPRYRRWTLSLSLLLCAASFVHHLWTGKTFEVVFTRALVLLSACFAPLPLIALVRSLMKQFQWRKTVLLLVVATGIWINLVDLLHPNASRSAVQSGYLLQVIALVWFLYICAFLITDFSKSLAAQRAQAQTMARELEAQRQELSRLHALEKATEQAEAAAKERARIMQDMHDGLGSQLVSSLVMARAGELSSHQTYDLLRSCIDDLRLAIDTANAAEDSLPLALGNLRFRMQPRLKAAGITLHWDTQALLTSVPLRPHDLLPLLRIVQESLTNALKHASAKNISVSATRSATQLTLRIADDGSGFDVEAAKSRAAGKGLASLDKRARVLGAQLELDSSEQGSVVCLRVPLVEP
jgi:signal transduction histidine kinase